MSVDTTNQHIEIRFIATENRSVTINEVGLFLYDLAILYELVRLVVDPKYKDFKFSRFALYRNRRRLKPKDRLYVQKIKQESPLEVAILIGTTTVSALSAVWVFVQLTEKIYNFRLNREKLEVDLEKASLDIEKAKLDIEKATLDKNKTELELRKLEREELSLSKQSSPIISLAEAEKHLEERNAIRLIKSVERKLERSPLQIRELDLKVINPKLDTKALEGLHNWLEKKPPEDS
ncbi:MAG TPA: hypothetical protein VF596_13310 [Pyrinomonadaceae bacterium]|jgi:hypothetical protein